MQPPRAAALGPQPELPLGARPGPEFGADPARCSCRAARPARTWPHWPPSPERPSFQPGFEEADTSVTAAIGLNGWYGGYHGQRDASLPLAMSGRMRHRLIESGVGALGLQP